MYSSYLCSSKIRDIGYFVTTATKRPITNEELAKKLSEVIAAVESGGFDEPLPKVVPEYPAPWISYPHSEMCPGLRIGGGPCNCGRSDALRDGRKFYEDLENRLLRIERDIEWLMEREGVEYDRYR